MKILKFLFCVVIFLLIACSFISYQVIAFSLFFLLLVMNIMTFISFYKLH